MVERPMTHYTQDDRQRLIDAVLEDAEGGVFRKASRIIAVQQTEPFTVETDRGPMTGQAGDWLVTNHPEDDAGSDLWTISAERMSGTYVEEPEIVDRPR